MNIQNLSVHYPGYNKFIKQMLILCYSISDQGYTKSIGFLEQTEIEILTNILTKFPLIKIKLFNKHDCCTKPLVYLYVDLPPIDESIFISLEYNSKYKKLGHSDVLGAFMNNGLKLSDFGDILVSDVGKITIITTIKILEYLNMYIKQISNLNVDYTKIAHNNIEYVAKQQLSLIVSSMRIDNVVGALANFSRTKSQKYVIDKNVRVNFMCVTSCSHRVLNHDIISIKKVGRYQILAINETKKNKFRVEVI